MTLFNHQHLGIFFSLSIQQEKRPGFRPPPVRLYGGDECASLNFLQHTSKMSKPDESTNETPNLQVSLPCLSHPFWFPLQSPSPWCKGDKPTPENAALGSPDRPSLTVQSPLGALSPQGTQASAMASSPPKPRGHSSVGHEWVGP